MPESGDGVDVDDQVQVLDGSTFMLSDRRGDVFQGSIAGLFHEDTRYLNRFVLTVGDATPQLLTSSEVDYYSAAFFLTNPDLPGIPGRTLTITRYRFVGGGLHERIEIASHSNDPIRVEVRISCGNDFADLFEVKEKALRKGGSTRTQHDDGTKTLEFQYEHRGF